MAKKVGDGLYVNVNVQIDQAVRNLNKLREAARQTATEINKIGRTGGTGAGATQTTAAMNSQVAAAKKAADATTRLGTAARKTASDQARLGQAMNQAQAGMYRFSQAFVNMRYGNPLGTVVGLSQGFGALGRSASTSAGAIGMIPAAIGAIVVAAVAATAAVGGLFAMIAAKGVQAASQLERMGISYEALLGSADRAREEVAFMQSMAKESIVPTENLMEANRLLLAYGVTADGTRRRLVQFFSDFAAATGLPTSRLNDMAYALGQVESQGKANQIDMRQLANAGLNLAAVYKEIAKQQGISAAEAREMVTEGKMTSDVLFPAILKIGDAYEEAGDKARNSFSGVMANLTDVIQVQASKAFTPVLKALTPIIRNIEEFIGRLAPTFEAVGRAITESIGQISAAFQGIDSEGNRALDPDFWRVALPQAIKIATQNILVMIATFRTMYEAAVIAANMTMNAFWSIAQAVSSALSNMMEGISAVVQAAADVGVIPRSWAAAMGDATNTVSAFSAQASSEAEAARSNIVRAANNIGSAWSRTFQMSLLYRVVNVTNSSGKYIGTPTGSKKAIAEDFTPPMPDMDFSNAGGGGTSGGGGGGGGKADTSKWSALIAWAKKLAAELAKAWEAINAALRRQFGELSQFQKAMTSGSTDSVIGMYNTISDNLNKSYDALIEMARGNKKQIKAIKAEQKREQRYLRKQTAAIIALNRENEKLEKARKKQYEVDKEYLEAEWADRLTTQSKAIEEATDNYEAANSKLQDLISERNSFVGQLQEGIRNFVNSFTASEETIQKYVRLDGAGSFMQTEERRSKSFKDALKDRLNALRNWVSNIEALRGRGLNASLLQQIVAGGPEATADLANELATASDSSLAEINAAQEELASQMQAMGDYAADAWYNQDISQQSEVVAGLKSVVDAAQATYDELETQRDQALADLETSYDKYNDEIGQQIKANEAKIAQMTNKMQERLKALGKEFKKSGLLAVEGLIEGITEKVKDVEKAAKMIADVLVKAIKKYLGIASPSKVGIYLGSMVAEGVAGGMESGISGVEAAAIKVANASLPMPDSAVGANTNVRVFIGDTELTDIVRTEIDSADASDLSRVIAGRRL